MDNLRRQTMRYGQVWVPSPFHSYFCPHPQSTGFLGHCELVQRFHLASSSGLPHHSGPTSHHQLLTLLVLVLGPLRATAVECHLPTPAKCSWQGIGLLPHPCYSLVLHFPLQWSKLCSGGLGSTLF